MHTEETTFYSDGLKLSGSFYLPDSGQDGPRPLVIACSGFTGLNSIHPARFARYLTKHGFLCFGFDYRGFAKSEGERGRVILEEQVRDVIHATAFAVNDPRADAGRIVLLGWGMGAGLVLDAARERPGLAGIVAINGFYCGRRVQVAHRGEEGYRRFREAVVEQLGRHAHTGEREEIEPFEAYPLDPQSKFYVDTVLRQNADYETTGYFYELANSLLRWHPEAYAPYMSTPILIAHGDRNELHPTIEAVSLLRVYAGPKQLYWIEGAGHTEFMHDDNPRFQALGARIVGWLNELFGNG